jgi:hypothetical protein
MVEFRLSLSPDETANMIPCLTEVADAIDPSSVLHTEALRSAQLVRIYFSGAPLAEQFIMRLVELGIEPERWALLAGPDDSTELKLPF